MPDLLTIKEQTVPDTPILLFECRLSDGSTERWASQAISLGAHRYQQRVLEHGSFELTSNSEDGFDGLPRVLLVLDNADAYISQIERRIGFKGSKLTVSLVLSDVEAGAVTTPAVVLFKGLGNPAEECNEQVVRLQFTNRLSLQRISLPAVRIQRSCPWAFPEDAAQREEAVSGLDRGKYSPYFRCGYSPDQLGGSGNLNGSEPFVDCDRSRQDCEARGMFDRDHLGRVTSRFGGVEFVPASSLVRGAGEASSRVSYAVDNVAKYNDVVPMLYGIAWYAPPIVFAKNDGNLTRLEVLLGVGEIAGVVKVVVNGVEIPLGSAGRDMSGTGWYNVVTLGNRSGGFNLDFVDRAGQPIGDPYGSFAYASVVVPNRVSDGRSLPRIEVLARGLRLSEFDSFGNYTGENWSSNPAWVLLDCLRRCGWELDEIDLASFGTTAAFCERPLSVERNDGSITEIATRRVNVMLRRRQSVAEIVRGIRQAAGLSLGVGEDGKLRLRPEDKIAIQHPSRSSGSNAAAELNGGWPRYEFGDGTHGLSSILRSSDGAPTIRLYSRTTAESPNRVSVEFQNEWNDYQQDSLSLVDTVDVDTAGQEVSAGLSAIGLPNPVQAATVARRYLAKSLFGNLYVEFETSIKGFGVWPDDLITVTYLREGLDRQLFRVITIAPGQNFETARIVAQVHDEDWYVDGASREQMSRREVSAEVGIPRPLLGNVVGEDGGLEYSVEEKLSTTADGQQLVELRVGFVPPSGGESARIAIPKVSFSPVIEEGTGTLAGGQTLYYGVTGVDEFGVETPFSFLVAAKLPESSGLNSVRLVDLSFSAGTASFGVFRGTSPVALMRIAENQPLSSMFVDAGLPQVNTPAPDPNYDHAQFYWRREDVPPVTATVSSSTTVGNDELSLITDEFIDSTVFIARGKGTGQERRVIAHDGNTFAISPAWSVVPDETSVFSIVEKNWRVAGQSRTDSIVFSVPNRTGIGIQIQGRSANVRNQESASENSLITRWVVGGGSGGDTAVPSAPQFGLAAGGSGNVEVVSVSFLSPENTRSIVATTLRLWFANELEIPLPTVLRLDSGVGEEIVLSSTAGYLTDDWIQIDRELFRVREVLGLTRLVVDRGVAGTEVVNHLTESTVQRLSSRTTILPFAKGFFGSPASGTYASRVEIPNVRIAAAEMHATNSIGDSAVNSISFTNTVDRGIRILTGGEATVYVGGYLSIQSNAGTTAVVGEARAIRDVFAVVQETPTSGAVTAEVRVNGDVLCSLVIEAGSAISNVVSGANLPPLQERSVVTVDIVGVPPSGTGSPGRDLTLTIRH